MGLDLMNSITSRTEVLFQFGPGVFLQARTGQKPLDAICALMSSIIDQPNSAPERKHVLSTDVQTLSTETTRKTLLTFFLHVLLVSTFSFCFSRIIFLLFSFLINPQGKEMDDFLQMFQMSLL